MKEQAGFTLIELIAVLVILALLGAMAVPRFVDVQSEALVAAKNGTKNAVKTAHALYIAENKALPDVGSLASYVSADGKVVGVGGGVQVSIDNKDYLVQTFTDTACSSSTSNVKDTVRCVGNITP